jgi:hypothetical protein
MRSKAASFLLGSLILPTTLASVCFICGCGDDSHTTGTLATKPEGADEARKRSIDYMKSNVMKTLPKK